MKKLTMFLVACMTVFMAHAQTTNTSTEVIDYREVEGKIVVSLVVNGVMADFVLDLAGHHAVLPEYLEKLNIDPNVPGESRYAEFQYKQVPVSGKVKWGTVTLGNSIFENDVVAFVLKDADYLRKLGVAGIVGSSLFKNTVLTIDANRKKITLSTPYRPSYMKLNYRSDISLIAASGIVAPFLLNGKNVPLLLDTWSDEVVVLNAADFAQFQTGPSYGAGRTRSAVQEKHAVRRGAVAAYHGIGLLRLSVLYQAPEDLLLLGAGKLVHMDL